MTLLEIENRSETRPVIAQIDEWYRSFPPTLMLYFTLKGIIGVIFNVVVLFFLILTGDFNNLFHLLLKMKLLFPVGWEVVDTSKRKATLEYVTKDKTTEPPTTVL